MAKRRKSGGGPPPGKAQGQQVQVPHDALVARFKTMNETGQHLAVLDFADKQPKAVATSPALLSAIADAATTAGDLPRAEALRRAVLKLEPGLPLMINDLILLLMARDAYAEAERMARDLVARAPDFLELLHNLGVILLNTGRWAEAESLARQVISKKSNFEISHFLLSQALLGQGKFEEGFRELESRTAPINAGRNITPPPVAYPHWRGEPLVGKSILIWMEQGLGDEIMMARYAKQLKARGAAEVSMVCRPPLAKLFKQLEGVDTLMPMESAFFVPRHDYWTYPMSLPLHCGTKSLGDIPCPMPYLGPSRAARSLARALRGPASAQLWVGLVWRGSTANSNDRNRSIPNLETLAPLWDVSGAGFFSLQKGQGEDQAAAPPAGQPIINLAADFDATAAFIERLDVVVTVDTSVAHLAGAMNKPCLLMLPATTQDWRWMDRAYSPWYPSMTLYRQATHGDWAPVVAQVASDLTRRVAAGSRPVF
jgi:hypothetical protein